MKVVYKMGIITARIGQTSPIANKILTLYGEGGPNIGPSKTLVLDATIRDKVLVKNLTPEDIKTGFNNGNVANHQLERASNVTNKEETMNIFPIQFLLHL